MGTAFTLGWAGGLHLCSFFFDTLPDRAHAYLPGHFHYAGMTTRFGRMWELEGDAWRDRRVYRLLALDNDLLSFTDLR